MKFSLFEISWYYNQWWISLFGFEYNDFDGHLFHIEWDMGHWKFDFLWLRPIWVKYWLFR